MRPTAVLASALVRAALVLTTDVLGAYGGGGGDGGERGGDGGEGGEGGGEGGDGGGGGGGAGQDETVPETPVRVIAQEQTMPPLSVT
eukprot:jgi/Chrpa1/27277/Chrysochromulina_OHIO_Genome00025182-RA